MNKFNPNFYLDAKDDAEMIQKAVDVAKECGEIIHEKILSILSRPTV